MTTSNRSMSRFLIPVVVVTVILLGLGPGHEAHGQNGQPQTIPLSDQIRSAQVLWEGLQRSLETHRGAEATWQQHIDQTSGWLRTLGVVEGTPFAISDPTMEVDRSSPSRWLPESLVAPQDAEFDRTLPDYTRLLELRDRIAKLDDWKDENAVIIAALTDWHDRWESLREAGQVVSQDQETRAQSWSACRTAALEYREARRGVLAVLPADDPRREQLPPLPALCEQMLDETSSPADSTGQWLIDRSTGAVGLLQAALSVLRSQRETRLEQERLLFTRRAIAENAWRQLSEDPSALEASPGSTPDDIQPLFSHLQMLLRRWVKVMQLHGAYLNEILVLGEQRFALNQQMDQVMNSLSPAAPEAGNLQAALQDQVRVILHALAEVLRGGWLTQYWETAIEESRSYIELEKRTAESIRAEIAPLHQVLLEADGYPLAEGDMTTAVALIDEHRQVLNVARQDLLQLDTRFGDLQEQVAERIAIRESANPEPSRRAFWARISPVRTATWESMILESLRASNARLQQFLASLEADLDAVDTADGQWDEKRTLISGQIESLRDRQLANERWSMFYTALGVLITIIATILVIVVLRKSVSALTDRRDDGEKSRRAKARNQRTNTILEVLSSLGTILFPFVGVVVILYIVGVGETLVNWLLGSVGILALAVSFGAQSVLKDFMAGFFILVENHYLVGDWITIGDVEGTVEQVGLRTTVLRDVQGNRHVVMNGNIAQVKNATARYSGITMDLGLSYDDDPDDVIPVLETLCQDMLKDEFLAEHLMPKIRAPRVLGIQSFDDSAVVYRISMTTRPGAQWETARYIRRMAWRTFKENGFTIPFPHRTVYNVAVPDPTDTLED